MISAPLPKAPIDIVLVCGGRRFADTDYLDMQLMMMHQRYKFRMLIHGEAAGADLLAKGWAMDNGVQPCGCPALWEYYAAQNRHIAAGPIRNRLMLILRPQLVIAFPGHTGTQHMIKCAQTAGVPFIDLADDYSQRDGDAPKK